MVIFPLLLALSQLPEGATPIATGITYRRIAKEAGGPFVFHVLEVDPNSPAVNILPSHALDRAAGKEATSAMAKRYGAVAAVNGGYFMVAGPYAGTSNGVYVSHGQILGSGNKRSALLFCREQDRRERTAIDVVDFRGSIIAAKAIRQIEGLNRPRAADELVLYTPALGPATLTDPKGAEAVIDAKGVVREITAGNTPIPRDGRVLSATGEAEKWLKKNLKPGVKVKLDAHLESPSLAACQPEDIVGAGPRLINGGKALVTPEGFAHQNVRHPRTVFAVTKTGKFLFITLDGRQSASVGMALPELAEELLRWGVVEAINLDGGGSSTLYAAGEIRNKISDSRERPVSDAILIFSIATLKEWRETFDKLESGQIQPALAAEIKERIGQPSQGNLKAILKRIRQETGKLITASAAQVLAEPLEELLAAGRW